MGERTRWRAVSVSWRCANVDPDIVGVGILEGTLSRRHHGQRVAEQPLTDDRRDGSVLKLERLTVGETFEHDLVDTDEGVRHAASLARRRSREAHSMKVARSDL